MEEMEERTTLSEYEQQRLRNIAEFEAFMAQDKEDIDRAAAELNHFTSTMQQRRRTSPAWTKRTKVDPSFRFTGQIPSERRRSARIMKSLPKSVEEEEEETEVVHELPPPKKKRASSSRGALAVIVPVESITKELLDKVALYSGQKKYSQNGTTCHQCRQKTADTKTTCRSGVCIGKYGYFCGPCLRNRYGEDIFEALLNPNWICPVCRGDCNCSFCQFAKGKAPTGMLIQVALQNGYKSVSHLLHDLDKHGNLPDANTRQREDTSKQQEDVKNKQEERHDDDRFLLGFTKDCVAVFQ